MDLPPFHVNSWQAAEENAARWMREWGFTGARVTPGGADSGIDVTSAKADAQVKYQASAVGRPAIQNLLGSSSQGKSQLFFCGSSYSKAAVEFADTRKVALFTYDLAGSVEAVNRAARRIVQAAQETTPNNASPARHRGSTTSGADQWPPPAGSRPRGKRSPIGTPIPPAPPEAKNPPMWLSLLAIGSILGGFSLMADVRAPVVGLLLLVLGVIYFVVTWENDY